MSDLLNSASLVMIPSGYKEDVVYSQIPTDGSGDLTFTRASNGTRVNSAGLVEVTPWNLLLNTDTFSSWNLEGGTLTSGFTAPDGSLTAYKYVQIPGGGLYSGSGGVTADVKCAQVWIKSVSGGSITVNLSDGAAFFGTLNVTGEWQLFTAPYTANSRIGLYLYGISNAQGIYVWHPQVNIGSTAKPYFPTTDRLNVPRLTYQNGGGGCPSLLLEKQSTNYARKNNDLVDWGIVNSGSLTKNLNAATSPDGTTNAINLVPNTANSAKMIYDNLTTQSSGGNFTMSCYAKANGYSKFGVRESATVGYYATFNLSTGTVIDNGGNTASIESVGNGWYRCIVSVVYSGTVNLGLLPLDDSYTSGQPLSYSYTGDGTKGVLVYGPQLEVSSSYATSLISTAGVASATRVADDCGKSSISSLIGQTEGVLFVDLKNPSGGDIASFGLNSSNTIYIIGDYNNSWGAGIIANSVNYAFTTVSNSASRIKIALAYKSGDSVLYINGVQVQQITSSFSFSASLSAVRFLPSAFYFSGPQCATYNQIAIFKTRLTNAELASLTTI